MKRHVFFLAFMAGCLALSSCERSKSGDQAANQATDKDATPESQTSMNEIEPVGAPPTEEPKVDLRIKSVNRLQGSFNPSAGEEASIRFELTAPATVDVFIHGPNRERIRHLIQAKEYSAGLITVPWDGTDDRGSIVPDEAYTFEIHAHQGQASDVWDPLLTTGGERVIAADLKALDTNRFSYQLPKASRVLVRAGVENGPLVRTLTNWKPRPKGFCIEYWDGMDQDGLRRIIDIEGVKIAVFAMALPEESIITHGRESPPYREYYLATAKDFPHKPKTPRQVSGGEDLISPFWHLPPHLNGDPKLSMSLEVEGLPKETSATPDDAETDVSKDVEADTSKDAEASKSEKEEPAGNEEEEALVLKGSPILVKVDIPDPAERQFMNDQKFELIIYVDDKRIMEIEQGHVPFTYPWDVSEIEPGRHVLTVNVASFRNHVGTISRRVRIER